MTQTSLSKHLSYYYEIYEFYSFANFWPQRHVISSHREIKLTNYFQSNFQDSSDKPYVNVCCQNWKASTWKFSRLSRRNTTFVVTFENIWLKFPLLRPNLLNLNFSTVCSTEQTIFRTHQGVFTSTKFSVLRDKNYITIFFVNTKFRFRLKDSVNFKQLICSFVVGAYTSIKTIWEQLKVGAAYLTGRKKMRKPYPLFCPTVRKDFVGRSFVSERFWYRKTLHKVSLLH